MQIVKWGGALDSNFTSNKWHHKLKRLQNRDKYRRIGIIVITIFVVFISIIYFTYSKFTSSGRFTIVDTIVQEFSNSDYVIASYINDEYSNSILTKEEATANNLIVYDVKCDNGAIGTWDSEEWLIKIKNATKKTKCNVYFNKGQLYAYTGKVQTFEAPEDGIYQLEVWGAQGGSIRSFIGGYGGYSKGEVQLNKGDIIYVVIGGKGSNTLNGGYNGGGNLSSGATAYGATGGGATHIASKTGLLNQLKDYQDNILIVAGVGGGANNRGEGYGDGNGGSGGDFIGNTGQAINHTNGYGYRYGTGGTQDSGGKFIKVAGTGSSGGEYESGSFGKSKDAAQSSGGSGYYGGGAGGHGGAGGGSGYIGNSLLTNKIMYCYNCQESNEEGTKTISTTNVSENPISNYAKIGDGYAKIKLLKQVNNN